MGVPPAFGRYDDLRSGESWVFPDIAYDLAATRPEHVLPFLAEVERASADGWWTYGFLSYEAAAGLDPGPAVHETVPGLPLA